MIHGHNNSGSYQRRPAGCRVFHLQAAARGSEGRASLEEDLTGSYPRSRAAAQAPRLTREAVVEEVARDFFFDPETVVCTLTQKNGLTGSHRETGATTELTTTSWKRRQEGLAQKQPPLRNKQKKRSRYLQYYRSYLEHDVNLVMFRGAQDKDSSGLCCVAIPYQ